MQIWHFIRQQVKQLIAQVTSNWRTLLIANWLQSKFLVGIYDVCHSQWVGILYLLHPHIERNNAPPPQQLTFIWLQKETLVCTNKLWPSQPLNSYLNIKRRKNAVTLSQICYCKTITVSFGVKLLLVILELPWKSNYCGNTDVFPKVCKTLLLLWSR